MPKRSTDPCDIQITSDLKVLFFDAGLQPICFYWNIHGQVVLTVKGSSKAFLAATPVKAITAAEAAMFGGL